MDGKNFDNQKDLENLEAKKRYHRKRKCYIIYQDELEALGYDFNLVGFLSFLINKHNQINFVTKNHSTWFYVTRKEIKATLSFAEETQRKYTRKLEKIGIIETAQLGVNNNKFNRKMHYKINYENLEKITENPVGIESPQNGEWDPHKMAIDYTTYNIYKNNFNKNTPKVPLKFSGENSDGDSFEKPFFSGEIKSSQIKNTSHAKTAKVKTSPNKSIPPIMNIYEGIVPEAKIKQKPWLRPANLAANQILPHILTLWMCFPAPYVDSEALFSSFRTFYRLKKEKGLEPTERGIRMMVERLKHRPTIQEVKEEFEKASRGEVFFLSEKKFSKKELAEKKRLREKYAKFD